MMFQNVLSGSDVPARVGIGEKTQPPTLSDGKQPHHYG
jgi:hypothetical protein